MGSILEALVDEPNFEWLMIDASYVKVHAHGTGAEGGSEAVERAKGGLNSKIHLAVAWHSDAVCEEGAIILGKLPD